MFAVLKKYIKNDIKIRSNKLYGTFKATTEV